MQNFCHQIKIAWHTYSLFREMWQHHKSAQQMYYSCCFTLTLPSETRWKKAISSANFSCLLRYRVTPGSSFFWATQCQIFIVPHQPISHLGHQYLAWMVIPVIHLGYWNILPERDNTFPLEIILRVFCWRMYLISYAQGIVACQWLAWLSFMFEI